MDTYQFSLVKVPFKVRPKTHCSIWLGFSTPPGMERLLLLLHTFFFFWGDGGFSEPVAFGGRVVSF